jgi:hypothetical protein
MLFPNLFFERYWPLLLFVMNFCVCLCDLPLTPCKIVTRGWELNSDMLSMLVHNPGLSRQAQSVPLQRHDVPLRRPIAGWFLHRVLRREQSRLVRASMRRSAGQGHK